MSRLSIKGQVFAIVGLLMGLSVAIAGVAFFAMSNVSETTRAVGVTAYRLNAVSAIRASMQSVTTNVREVVLAQGEEKKKAIKAEIERVIAPLDAEMRKIGETTRLRDDWRELTTTWEKHKAVAAKIIDLSVQDSNEKALALVVAECNPLREKEMELFRTVFHGQEGLEDISTLMLSIPTDVREIVLTADMAKMREIKDRIDKTVAELDARMASLGPRMAARPEWKTLTETWNRHKDVAGRIIELTMRNTNGQAMEILTNECNPLRQDEDRIFTTIMKKQEEFLTDIIGQAEADSKSAVITLAAAAGVSLVLGLLLSWLTVARLSQALMQIIEKLSHSSSQVFDAANSVSVSSRQLASGVNEQSSALESTSSALEEMSSMTRQSADNATQTNETTGRTVALIEQGAQGVANMSQAMGEISESAEQISHIIKTIEGISFQTNLLALNAAVEAARAGEAGAGFAVVADEVRNLAQRSAQAAQDTSGLIESTVTRVKRGSEIAASLDSNFKIIDEGSKEVGRLVGEISTATAEQAQGVEQVSAAVSKMDQIMQSNAAAAEESAAASKELTNQAEALNGMVDELVAVVTGARGQAA